MESMVLEGHAFWRQEISLPYIIYQGTSVVVGNKVFLSGGYAEAHFNKVSSMIEWSVGAASWTHKANISEARSDHFMATDGHDHIWVISYCHNCLLTVEQYTISTDTWKVITTIPQQVSRSLYFRQCVYWDGYIIVQGSRNSYSSINVFHLYNVTADVWTKSTTSNTYTFSNNLMIALIP